MTPKRLSVLLPLAAFALLISCRAPAASAPTPTPAPTSAPARIRAGWPKVGPSGNVLVVLTEATADGSDAAVSALAAAGGATLTADGKTIALTDPLYTSEAGDNVIVWPLGPKPVIAVVDDAAAAKTGTWTEWTRKWSWDAVLSGGSLRYSDTPTDTITYGFTGLVPGTYRVSINPAIQGSTSTTDAAFTCADGRAPPVVFHQDQTAATRFDRSDLGLQWLDLGTVPVAGTTLNVTLANAAGKGTLNADAVRVEQVLGRAVPADAKAITFSAPAGWATTTAGDLGAASNVPVALATDADWFPYDPAAWRGMRVGYNLNAPIIYTGARVFANLLRTGGSPAAVDGGVVDYDPQGYPTAASTGPFEDVFLQEIPATVDNHGINLLVPGTYTVRSKGTGTPSIVDSLNEGWFTAAAAVPQPADPATGKRVWTIDVALAKYTPLLPRRAALRFDGPATEIELLAPGTPAGWTRLTSPAYQERYNGRGYAAVRLLDALPINGSGVVEFADFDDPDQFGIMTVRREQTAAIAAIEPADLADPAFQKLFVPRYALSVLKVTTAAPHGLRDGNTVRLYLDSNNGPDTSGGTTYTTPNWYMPVTVISDTQFYAETGNTTAGNTLATLKAPLAFGGGKAYSVWGGGTVGPRTLVDVCNELGVDPWLLVPHAASDDCVTAMFAMIATRLDPKLRCRVEYTNEHWNAGFPQFSYCIKMAHRSGDPALGSVGSKYYARRAGQVHRLARAAFVAAGRPATDVIRVMGSQAGSDGVTDQVLSQCVADGTTFEELAVDTYLGNRPRLPDTYAVGADAAYDRLDLDGLIDVLGVNQHLTHYRDYVTPHLEKLREHGFAGVDLVSYEGGYDYLCPFGSDVQRNRARAVAMAFHPRIRRAHLARLQSLDQAGVSLVERYLDDGSNGVAQGTVWVDHPVPFQADGIGDGSDGKNDNRENPWDYSRVVSVLGQAQREYAALALKPPTPTPVPTPTPTPVPTPTPTPVPPPSPPGTYSVVTSSLGTVGVAQTVTVAPDREPAGPVTVTLGSDGGSFDRPAVAFAAGATGPVVVHFIPARAGTVAIAATNDAGMTDPAASEIEVVRHLSPGKKGAGKTPKAAATP